MGETRERARAFRPGMCGLRATRQLAAQQAELFQLTISVSECKLLVL